MFKQKLNSILRKNALESDFFRNTFTLTIGTTVAQAFPMIFYPVLSRIYLPEEFGLLATLTSITSILVVLATGKYENSILITNTKKDAANIIMMVLALSMVFLLLTFIVFCFLTEEFSIWFNEPGLKVWLYICPLTAFSIIIFNCYNEWCVRNKYFATLSGNKIMNSASTSLSKLLFGFVKISSNGLVIGDLVGRIITAVHCIFRSLHRDGKFFFAISRKRMLVLARRYKEFPRYSLPDQLIDTLNSQLPTLMIAYTFLSTKVGYYAMAGNVLSVPVNVISVAVRDVFRQRANEEWAKVGNCRNIYVKVVRMLFIIIVPSSILLMIILPDFFSILLGKNWRTAGEYARILMPHVAILFMFRVVSAVFIIANKLRASFIWQFYSISLTIISLSIGCFVLRDMKKTLICYVIARCIANLTRFYMTYNYSKGKLIT